MGYANSCIKSVGRTRTADVAPSMLPMLSTRLGKLFFLKKSNNAITQFLLCVSAPLRENLISCTGRSYSHLVHHAAPPSAIDHE